MTADIPFSELAAMGKLHDEEFEKAISKYIVYGLERNSLVGPSQLRSSPFLQIIIDDRYDGEGQLRAVRELEIYLDGVEDSSSRLISEMQIDQSKDNLALRFRWSRRLADYSFLVNQLQNRMHLIIQNSHRDMMTRLRSEKNLEIISKHLDRLSALLVEVPLYGYATTLSVFENREKIISHYRANLYRADGSFKISWEQAEYIGQFSSDAEFERVLKDYAERSDEPLAGKAD
jgi:hypothetical protein